ncbi:MAG TPA: terminase gpA endonuclease subunit, partial [Anaeromyxobacteraceae bacterium]|nr:terminase gpA endonuclease subunit [Anaeromyxobacteraceae bacterium]
DVAWGSLVVSPVGMQATTEGMHEGLNRLNRFAVTYASEAGRPLVRRGVDVGDRQDELRLWLVRNRDWWAVKGSNGAMRLDDNGFDLAEWLYRREQEGRWYLYLVDVDSVRRQAQAGFLVPPGKPGAAHLPSGVTIQDSIVRHYCALAEIPDGRGGTRWSERERDRELHAEWQRRHDLLDCRVYALALGYQYSRRMTSAAAAERAARPEAPEHPMRGADEWAGAVEPWGDQ